jgi:hypothetical protein
VVVCDAGLFVGEESLVLGAAPGEALHEDAVCEAADVVLQVAQSPEVVGRQAAGADVGFGQDFDGGGGGLRAVGGPEDAGYGSWGGMFGAEL